MAEEMHDAASAVSSLPLSLLHAEIRRRQNVDDSRPACGSGGAAPDYNTPLHVLALVVVLVLSTLACSFPLAVRRFPRLPVPNTALFLSRHFGTGVLIATAFVHLLPTAYISLTDPCLPPFWNRTYPAFAGFASMVSVLLTVSIEMFFAMRGAGHSHSLDLDELRSGDATEMRRSSSGSGTFRPPRSAALGVDIAASGLAPSEPIRSPYVDSPGAKDKPLPPPPEEDAIEEGEEDDLDLDELDPNSDEAGLLPGSTSKAGRGRSNGHPRRGNDPRSVSFADPLRSHTASPSSPPLNSKAEEERLVLQCLLLEAGILFHSIFIGLALSVSTGSAFIVLLIAICFHQTFEGLALGSRIAAIPSFSTEGLQPWVMSLMYGVTVPIGQAIGLAVHSLYDPASQFGLLTVGIVNAISSGLLVYAGLVQLLAEDFLSAHSYHELYGRKRLEAYCAVITGSLLMAFVGAFA